MTCPWMSIVNSFFLKVKIYEILKIFIGLFNFTVHWGSFYGFRVLKRWEVVVSSKLFTRGSQKIYFFDCIDVIWHDEGRGFVFNLFCSYNVCFLSNDVSLLHEWLLISQFFLKKIEFRKPVAGVLSFRTKLCITKNNLRTQNRKKNIQRLSVHVTEVLTKYLQK